MNARSFIARFERKAALVAAAGVLAVILGAAAPAGDAFPGSNGKIAFAAYDGVSYNIWVMNADGSGRTLLTSSLDWETEPAFSPDGSRIAFTRGETTPEDDIWVMNADGTGQTNLTPGPGQEGNASWSPDGSKIAFETTRDGNREVYVMNADGSSPTNLSKNGGTPPQSEDGDPDWSPDGSRIAFRSFRDGNGEIYLMNPDGSGQTNVTQHPGSEFHPAWSPDGTKIAFSSFRDNTNDIWVMNADGSSQTNLTNHANADQYPSWSPDGSKIAFATSRDGHAEVYVMNADGTTQTNLTQSIGEDGNPDWQTVPSADLALSLETDTVEAKAQKPLTFAVRVENTGPSNAAGLVVTNTLPAEARFVSASSSQGSCVAPPVGSTGTVTCDLGFVLQGHSATAEIVVKFVSPKKSSVTNAASVASATPDPYTANNSAAITTHLK